MDNERADRDERRAAFGVERSCGAAPVGNPQSAIRNPQSAIRNPQSEQGWALLTVMFFSALLVMTLAYSIPRTVVEAKREREARLLDYGKEYQRAIGLYFRKFQRYPAKIEDLENTNNIRFLRKRFSDPVSGSTEWRFVHMGPGGVLTDSVLQQPGTGQAVAGTTSAGTGDTSGQSTTPGQSPRVGQPPGSSQPVPQQPGMVQYGQQQSTFSQPQPVTTQSQSSFGQQQSTFGQQQPRAGVQSGQQGGAVMGNAIAGIASTSTEGSIKLYNNREKYNEWEFVYDYSRDPFLMGGVAVGGQIGVPGSGGRSGQPGFGNQPGVGNQPGFGGAPGLRGTGPQQPFGTQQPGFGQQPIFSPGQPFQPGIPDQRRVPPGPIRP